MLALTGCGASASTDLEDGRPASEGTGSVDYRFAPESKHGELTRCGEIRRDISEQYDFTALDEEVRLNPAVARDAGVTQVASCSEARAFSKAALAFREGEVAAADKPAERAAPVNDEVGQTQQAMRGGTPTSERGMVQINGGGCTGFIFTSRVIVTAAHCLPSRSGSFQPSLMYWRPGGNTWLNWAGQSFDFHMHPQWAGGVEPRYDVGIIVANSPLFFTPQEADTLPILWGDPRIIGTGRYYGSGWDGGATVMRRNDFPLDWTSSDSLYTITRGQKSNGLCVGDSGGPGTLIMNGVRTVASLNQSVDMSSGGRCSGVGSKQRHASILPEITNWIRSTTSPSQCTWDTDSNLQQSFVNCAH